MLANLSFKAKLLFLLITAVMGFIIVTFVAMGGLSSQQKANNELRKPFKNSSVKTIKFASTC